MNARKTSTAKPAGDKRRVWVIAACLLVVPLAMKLGYDFGSQLGGPLLGLAAAGNFAVFCAFMIDAAVDRLASATGVLKG